jgi:hypothetical protein
VLETQLLAASLIPLTLTQTATRMMWFVIIFSKSRTKNTAICPYRTLLYKFICATTKDVLTQLMTKLSSIPDHQLSITCGLCKHHSMLEVANLIAMVGEDATAHDVRQRYSCPKCKAKGNNTYQIIYRGTGNPYHLKIWTVDRYKNTSIKSVTKLEKKE